MKKTVLITGINGFLGSHLAKILSADFEIIGLVRDAKSINRLEGFDFQIYESTDTEIIKLFKEHIVFSVIHAATVYRTDGSINNMLVTNIILPIKLYDLANSHGVEIFINTDTFFNQPEIKYNYLSEYSMSKKHVLEWLYVRQGGCKLVNMKLFHMYGPGDSPLKFVNAISTKLKADVECIPLTKGEQKRDFIHIDDVVEAYKTVLKNVVQLKSSVEFEVGTGESVSIRDFLYQLKKHLKSNSTLEFGSLEYRKNEFMDSKANNKNLRELGWCPKVDFQKGIKLTFK